MKKLAIAVAAILAAAALYQAGRHEGVRHAIEDSIIWTVECYDPENPYENSREDGTDQTIYIELDDQLWSHGMYQG